MVTAYARPTSQYTIELLARNGTPVEPATATSATFARCVIESVGQNMYVGTITRQVAYCDVETGEPIITHEPEPVTPTELAALARGIDHYPVGRIFQKT